MIYETAILAHADLDDERVSRIKSAITGVVQENQGEIYLEEDWGVKQLAQPTEKKISKGHYLYFIYTAGSKANSEINRRMRINEDVIRSMVITLGELSKKDEILKNHKKPFAS